MTAVFTIAMWHNEYFKYTIPSIEEYARKTGSDFIKLDSQAIWFNNIYFEKFHIIELLEKYDRVLYLDADIIVTPHARNIFETYADTETFYAYNENGSGLMDRDIFVEPLIKDGLKWDMIDSKYIYFNAGVFLASKPHRHIFLDYKTASALPFMLQWDTDQTLMNYLVVKNNIPFGNIDYSFNRMSLAKEDKEGSRFSADFIHYAGPDIYWNGNKPETMRNDYNFLYQKSIL